MNNDLPQFSAGFLFIRKRFDHRSTIIIPSEKKKAHAAGVRFLPGINPNKMRVFNNELFVRIEEGRTYK